MSNLDAWGIPRNAFYRVNEEVVAWQFAGYEDTNHYYGAAQICRGTYTELRLKPGDQIHWLVGGVFLVQDAESRTPKALIGRVVAQNTDKSPFERSYGDPSTETRNQIGRLIADGKITKLANGCEATIAQYPF